MECSPSSIRASACGTEPCSSLSEPVGVGEDADPAVGVRVVGVDRPDQQVGQLGGRRARIVEHLADRHALDLHGEAQGVQFGLDKFGDAAGWSGRPSSRRG